MRKILLYAFLLTGFTSFSQVKIILHDDPADAINGTTVEFAGDPSDFFVIGYMQVINQSGAPLETKIRRKRLITPDANAIEQLCNSSQCYDTGNTEFYITDLAENVGVNDTVTMKPQFRPEGTSFCAYNRYYVVNSFGVAYDSVDVKFNVGNQDCSGTASLLEEQNEYNLTVYPNPASDVLNLKMQNIDASYGFRIVDILGNVVYNEKSNVSDRIYLDNLKSGVYFYSLVKNGKAIETKKLVVKK